jgi:hypothetical protein
LGKCTAASHARRHRSDRPGRTVATGHNPTALTLDAQAERVLPCTPHCVMPQRRCPFCGTIRAKSRSRCSSKSSVRSRARRCCTAGTGTYSRRLSMYTEEALRRRGCTAVTKSGKACRAFACWDDPLGRCVSHSGRHHVGPLQQSGGMSSTTMRRRRTGPTCRCPAYTFPHRAASGWCCWPQQPAVTSLTPPSTHAWPRRRRPSWWSRLR